MAETSGKPPFSGIRPIATALQPPNTAKNGLIPQFFAEISAVMP
jgi:hypothetical protein